MDIIELLRKLKHITPRPDFVHTSRYHVLHSSKRTRSGFSLVFRVLLRGVETGGAIVLAGIIFIFLVGGLSSPQSELLTPFRLSGLNLEGIRAEAEAIDIQIKLADLNYPEKNDLALTNETTTPPVALPLDAGVRAAAESIGLDVSATSTARDASIDEALRLLSE